MAIYGTRDANGVILITTKRGSTGGGRITYDTELSVPTIGPHRVEMLDAREYLDVENLAYDNIKVYDPTGWATGSFNNFLDPKEKRKKPQRTEISTDTYRCFLIQTETRCTTPTG